MGWERTIAQKSELQKAKEGSEKILFPFRIACILLLSPGDFSGIGLGSMHNGTSKICFQITLLKTYESCIFEIQESVSGCYSKYIVNHICFCKTIKRPNKKYSV